MGVTKSAMKIHWRGTVGGIVGSRQYGQDTWRSLADTVSNPNTEAQQEARARFSFISKSVAFLGYLYRLGYKAYIGSGRGPRALFSKSLGDTAVTGNMSDGYALDMTKVQISRGSLAQAYNQTAAATAAEHKVTLTWTDNSGVADAEATDQICIQLSNLTKRQSLSFENVAARADEECEVSYPTAWGGDSIDVFIFWNGADKGCSTTQHLGPLTA